MADNTVRLDESDDELLSALHLNLISGIGPRTFGQLIERFGSACAVTAAAPSDLRTVPGINAKLAREISSSNLQASVAEELERCRQKGISLLHPRHGKYPRRLTEIYDPPPILYQLGETSPRDELAIAIVGTRHPSTYGRLQTERFARGLALAGLTIVSGFARGIDAVAHKAALDAGGRTIAVLGSGLLNLYPPDHAELANRLVNAGAILSEFPTLQPPKAGAFPRRNRLVSGLSLGVLVIEAAERSGALISAKHAYEQGREVFALPGRVDQRNTRGCHRLIRDGAKLVESIDDVLAELGPLPTPAQVDDRQRVHHPAELALNEREQTILQAIDREGTSIDLIVARTQIPVQHVLSVISILEMRHLIRRLAGNQLMRV